LYSPAHRIIVTSLFFLVLFSPLVTVRPVAAERSVGPTWDRTFLSIDPGGGSSVEQTSDGGFIMSAQSSAEWVMKMNARGMPEWQREYGGGGNGQVSQTSDRGYIVVGGNQLLKLDHMGNVEWSRKYYLTGGMGLFSGQQTTDGGYIALGEWLPVVGGLSQAWLVRLSRTGAIEWQQAYAGQGFVEPYSVQETFDGGFVVAAGLPWNNSQKAWVFKTDPMGRMVWQKAYSVPGEIDHHAYQVRQTSDGGYVVAADIIVFRNGAQSSVAWILRLGPDGNILWQKSYDGGGFVQPSSVAETSDGGFIVAGRFMPRYSSVFPFPPVGLSGPFLLRLDSAGNLVWQKIYGGANDFLFRVQETSDGGIIAVGSNVGGFHNCCNNLAWALKLDSNGNLRGCPVDVPSNATLTDTNAIVTTTTVTAVNTNAIVSSTDLTVTTPTFPSQDLCSAKTKTPVRVLR